MTKILDEVRAISSDAVAKKQDAAKNKLPKLIEQIKGAAALGKTTCEFAEYEIDEYSKKLLEVEGFRVYTTTKVPEKNRFGNPYKDIYGFDKEPKTVWIASW